MHSSGGTWGRTAFSLCSKANAIKILTSMGHSGLLCSPRYSWVTYFILSNICNFSQLFLSTHPLLLYQFCHLINLSSSYQTSVIFSPLVTYSLFTLSTCPINAPAVHTTKTTLFPVLSCPTSRLWPSCHSDYGGIGPWLGVFSKNNLLPSTFWNHWGTFREGRARGF